MLDWGTRGSSVKKGGRWGERRKFRRNVIALGEKGKVHKKLARSLTY